MLRILSVITLSILLSLATLHAQDPPPPENSTWTLQALLADDPEDPGPHDQNDAQDACDQMETDVQVADVSGFDNDWEADRLLENHGNPPDIDKDTYYESEKWYRDEGLSIVSVDAWIRQVEVEFAPGQKSFIDLYIEKQTEGDLQMVDARWMRTVARNRLAAQEWNKAYNAAIKASRTAGSEGNPVLTGASRSYAQAATWLDFIQTASDDIASAVAFELEEDEGDE